MPEFRTLHEIIQTLPSGFLLRSSFFVNRHRLPQKREALPSLTHFLLPKPRFLALSSAPLPPEPSGSSGASPRHAGIARSRAEAETSPPLLRAGTIPARGARAGVSLPTPFVS
ncbi:hypothetical protein NL676_010072 [Syzygium grande]|nr:hypothetical protein NL676_010072 [Syzygium grande]